MPASSTRRRAGRRWPADPTMPGRHSRARSSSTPAHGSGRSATTTSPRSTTGSLPPDGFPPGSNADDRLVGEPGAPQALAARRHPVGVEDCIEVAQCAEKRAERLHVPELGRIPVARHAVFDGAAVRDDVRAVLGERPGDVLEQPGAIPAVDGDLDAEAGRRRVALPLDRREALGVPHQRLDVGAVGAMDRDPATERDVAPDLVARHRCAALREPYEDVVDAGDDDTERVPADDALAGRRLRLDDGLVRDVVDLETLLDLVDDVAGADLPGAEGEIEVLRLLEPEVSDHRGEDARALELAVREVLRLERLVERVAALLLGLAAGLALEPLPDLVASPCRPGDREPVARRPTPRLRGEDLDEVAVLQVVVERNDPAVHLGADSPVADVRVDGVCEVDGARAGRQRLDLALRREDVHLVVEEVGPQRSHVLG